MSLLNNISCYYKLDGNPNRSFGTNDGGNNFSNTYTAGLIGQTATFSGANQFIDIVDSSDFTFGSADLGISFWIKRGGSNGVRQIFIGQSDSIGYSTSISFIVEFTTTNLIYAQFCAGNTSNSLYDTSAITDTNWHHIVLTRSGNVFYLFVDNVQKASATYAITINDSTRRMGIGRGGEINSLYLNGSIDEFGIWKRFLATDDVAILYNSGRGLTYPFTNGYYNFFL